MDSLLLLDQELLDGAQGLLQLANCGNSRTTDGKICKFRKLFFFFLREATLFVFSCHQLIFLEIALEMTRSYLHR